MKEIKGYVELRRLEKGEGQNVTSYGSSPDALGTGTKVDIPGGASYRITLMIGQGTGLLVEAIMTSGNQRGIISKMGDRSLVLRSDRVERLRLSLEAEVDD